MNNKNKKLATLVIMVILALLVGTIFSQAKTLSSLSDLTKGKNIKNKIYIDTLQGTSNLYCVQRDQHFTSGTYTVTKYVKIEGKTATDNKGKTTTKRSNAIMAYLLAGGTGYGSGEGYAPDFSDRQRNVWGYFNTWKNNSAKKFGINWDAGGLGSHSANDNLTKEAENYADSKNKDYKLASIANLSYESGSSSLITSNTYAGPFKVKYHGKISSVEVKATDDSVINNGISFYSDKQARKPIKASNIKSKSKFYIKNDSGKTIKSVTIKVKAKSTITVEMWFLINPNVKEESQSPQRLMYVKPGTTSSEASVEINIKTTGNIKAYKYDEDEPNKVPANSLGGVKYKVRIGNTNEWLKGTPGNWNYKSSFADATVFTTVKGKGVAIEDLANATYGLYEVGAPAEYTLEQQKGYDKTNKWVYAGAAKVTEGDKNITITQTNVKNGNIVIKKVDKDSTNTKLEAGFIIKTEKGWLSGEGTSASPWKYDSKSAQIYRTPNGERTLSKVAFGKYTPYEVEAPEGYDLKAQTVGKYVPEGNGGKGWIEFDTIELNGRSPNRTATFNLVNVQKISIEGKVFIDTPVKNANSRDKIYTENTDKLLKGVKVELVNKSTGKAIATQTTNENGYYIFEKLISSKELNNYYVRYDYSTFEGKEKDKKYIPIEFNVAERGSKALVNEMPTEDDKLVEIASTYNATAKEGQYGLSKLYSTLAKEVNGKGIVLTNINLGIVEIHTPDYSLENNLESVRIEINGYKYTYKYGTGDENKEFKAAPKVQWEGKITYSRPIYPSDIVYVADNKNDNLKVFVKYRIDIKNIESYNIEDIYQEKALHVTSLTNTFDTERYVLSDNNWTANNGTATIKDLGELKSIGKNEVKTTHIEFSVKENAIKDILKNPEGIVEKKPTNAISNAYHTYERAKDYSWKNDIVAKQTHTTKTVHKNDEAPYLKFMLGEDRIVTGKVFEDKSVSTNGEKLGNGKLDNGEKTLENVKVELLSADKKTITKVYPRKQVLENNEYKEDAIKQSNNGTYTISGLVPGEYYLRFTYGNGESVTTTLDGKPVNAKEYKSTIITSDAAKKSITEESKVADTKHTWYKNKDILNGNYSTALDDLAIREKINAGTSTCANAYTGKISITVEDTEGDELFVEHENADTIRTYGGFNFGIIEAPKENIEISKIITNIKLVNTDNQEVFNGNPASTKMQGVSDLSANKNQNGSTNVKAELDESLIYGSTLNITYAIQVKNTSDVNYATDNYYWYGEDKQNETTLKLDVKDYLDKTLEFINASEGITADAEQKDIYKKEVNLYTNNNKARKDNEKTSETISLLAKRLLSKEDDDMEMINKVVAKKLTTTIELKDNTNLVNRLAIIGLKGEPEASARMIVTPPTGGDKISPVIYVSAGLGLLAILSAGIVVIKKKVL